jgi:Big-like domain-containing protein/Ig-like domain-containing protein
MTVASTIEFYLRFTKIVKNLFKILIVGSVLAINLRAFCQSATNLVGEKLSTDWRYPDTNTSNVASQGYPVVFTVPPGGTNFALGVNPNLSVSVTGDTITLGFPGPGDATYGFSGPPGSLDGAIDVGPGGEPVTFNGAVITDSSNIFSGVTIISVTALPGLDSSRVYVSSNALYVNFMGLYNTPGLSQVVLRLQVLKEISIVTQPQSQIVAAGSPVTFSMMATGAPPLTYQWRLQGTNVANNGHLTGSLSNQLTLTTTSAGDIGNYDVIVSNSYGAVTSSIASLTITNPPTNLIVNGSFEAPSIPANSFEYGVPTGWTWTPGLSSSTAIESGIFTYGGAGYGPAEDGQQSFGIGSVGDGSLSQVVTVASAGNYRLSWYATVGNEQQASSPSPYQVSFGNISGQFDAGISLAQSWEPQTLQITNLAPGIYTLTFTPETVQGGFATIIDNVTLSSAPFINPPIAISQAVAGLQNTALPITLTGSDPNSPPLPLSFTITSSPTHGSLSGVAPSLIYTPSNGYLGFDSFEFAVNNGVGTSASMVATVTVVAPEQPLTASVTVADGQMATASVPASQSQAGVTATLDNILQTQPATVSVQSYSSNPTPIDVGGPGTTFVDVRVLGATPADIVSLNFVPPANLNNPAGTISPLILLGNGVGAVPSLPPGWFRVHKIGITAPIIIPTSSSLGSGTVTIDLNSFPIITQLAGTVFALATIAPPVPGVNNWGTLKNQPVSMPATNLLAGARSPTLGPLGITAVNSPSTKGGTVSLNAGVVSYSPPIGFVGQDSFTYTLSDDVANAPATVTVTVVSSTQQSYNQLSAATSGPCVVIQFLGIPNSPYVMQSSDSPGGPWTDLSPALVADAAGLIIFTDCNLTVGRFYRIRTGQ